MFARGGWEWTKRISIISLAWQAYGTFAEFIGRQVLDGGERVFHHLAIMLCFQHILRESNLISATATREESVTVFFSLSDVQMVITGRHGFCCFVFVFWHLRRNNNLGVLKWGLILCEDFGTGVCFSFPTHGVLCFEVGKLYQGGSKN